MIELALPARNTRWQPSAEVWVSQPGRGAIYLLHTSDRGAALLVPSPP